MPCLEHRCHVTPDALGREAVLAMEAVRGTVQFVRKVDRQALCRSVTKPDASPATIADFVVQALVVSRLALDFAGDSIVAEEDAAPLRDDRLWGRAHAAGASGRSTQSMAPKACSVEGNT